MDAVIKRELTPEELLHWPDSVGYELVDGQLVERHSGAESSAVAAAVAATLGNFVKKNRAGYLFAPDCGYRCFPDSPRKVRKPDVSFIRMDRLSREKLSEGYVEIAPDLAVEVLSPGDLAEQVDLKVQEYLDAGVQLVWVISPKTRSVRIHRPDNSPRGPISVANESATLSGEDVLPGFECKVAEFFDI